MNHRPVKPRRMRGSSLSSRRLLQLSDGSSSDDAAASPKALRSRVVRESSLFDQDALSSAEPESKRRKLELDTDGSARFERLYTDLKSASEEEEEAEMDVVREALPEHLAGELGVVYGIGGGGGVGSGGMAAMSTSRRGSVGARKNARSKSLMTTKFSAERAVLSTNAVATNRYFTPKVTIMCYRCGEPGHEKRDCTLDGQVVQNCWICARAHAAESCPYEDFSEKISCFWCSSENHHFTDCPSYKPKSTAQGLTCYNCGEVGHIYCGKIEMSEASLKKKVSCPRCGERHAIAECDFPSSRELIPYKIYKGLHVVQTVPIQCLVCRGFGHDKRTHDAFVKHILRRRESSHSDRNSFHRSSSRRRN